jgi:hypothetical protein
MDEHHRGLRLWLQLAASGLWPVTASDAQPVFVRDFVAAWTKVMNLDDSTSRKGGRGWFGALDHPFCALEFASSGRQHRREWLTPDYR